MVFVTLFQFESCALLFPQYAPSVCNAESTFSINNSVHFLLEN